MQRSAQATRLIIGPWSNRSIATGLRLADPLAGSQDGQREVKCRAPIRSVRSPQPPAVRSDNGLADREAESQSLLFRRKKRIENPLELLGIDASAAIENRCLNRTVLRIELDDYFYPAVAGRVCIHRLAGIQYQVQKHLLQLHPVTLYRWDELVDAGADLHVAAV